MKRLSFSIILILLIIAASDMPQARVTGVCSNCHTMHNSQGGGPMAQTLTSPTWGWADDATPNPSLLMYSCVGCHTDVGSGATIGDSGTKPIVFNVSDPVNPLAGGNFHYLIADGQGNASGHNVVGIIGADSNFTGYIPGSATTYSGNQVTCAGTKGCHGDRAKTDQLDAMKTAHHTNDTGGTATSPVGLGYRFLNGILGTEDDDWEQNVDIHNEYQGATDFTTTSAISYLCGNCHGNFHSATGAGSGSPWVRHPTDYMLPGGETEYADYTTYSMTAPVARTSPGASSNVVGPGTGTAIVMCLSCHRAHASPNYKMIRWNYRDWPAAGANGCAICHTWKQ